MILCLYWRKLTWQGACAGIIVGAVTVAVWGNLSGGIFDLYEIVPGFVFNLLVSVAVSMATYRRNNEIDAEFDAALDGLAA